MLNDGSKLHRRPPALICNQPSGRPFHRTSSGCSSGKSPAHPLRCSVILDVREAASKLSRSCAASGSNTARPYSTRRSTSHPPACLHHASVSSWSAFDIPRASFTSSLPAYQSSSQPQLQGHSSLRLTNSNPQHSYQRLSSER